MLQESINKSSLVSLLSDCEHSSLSVVISGHFSADSFVKRRILSRNSTGLQNSMVGSHAAVSILVSDFLLEESLTAGTSVSWKEELRVYVAGGSLESTSLVSVRSLSTHLMFTSRPTTTGRDCRGSMVCRDCYNKSATIISSIQQLNQKFESFFRFSFRSFFEFSNFRISAQHTTNERRRRRRRRSQCDASVSKEAFYLIELHISRLHLF
jgi:hypothetical protein